MDGMQIVSLLLRLAHLMAAATLIGGTIFQLYALLPAAEQLPEEPHRQLKAGVIKRWKIWVMVAITFLLVSGLVNYVLYVKEFKLPSTYHMLFGVKFLLALVIFFIASLLTGRSPLAEKARQNAKTFLTINLILAILVVGIGGMMRNQQFLRVPKANLVAQ